MKLVAFNAFCPFEIGDKVKVEGIDEPKVITDIACVHYVKSNRIDFRYELDDSGTYNRIEARKGDMN